MVTLSNSGIVIFILKNTGDMVGYGSKKVPKKLMVEEISVGR